MTVRRSAGKVEDRTVALEMENSDFKLSQTELAKGASSSDDTRIKTWISDIVVVGCC